MSDLRAVLDSSYLDATAPEDGGRGVSEVLAATGRAAERAFADSGLLARLATLLGRSDWSLSAGEFLAASTALGGVGLLVGLVSGAPLLAVLLVPALGMTPYLFLTRSVGRRQERFDEQLPDVLDLVAASLEAGSSIAQAVELVVAEADEPAASEFARCLAATRLGATLVDGLDEMCHRLGSRDLLYTVQAIRVQQRTGGRLADILRSVASFMRSRFELRRDIKALTAEGRLSGYILGGLPFFLALVITLEAPHYLEPLFTTTAGLVMLAGGGLLMAVAFWLMSRIVRVEV